MLTLSLHALAAGGQNAAAAAPAVSGPAFTPIVIELSLNGGAALPAKALRRPGALLVDRTVLQAFRIRLPPRPAQTDGITSYDDLSLLPRADWRLDEGLQSVDLRIPYEGLQPDAVSAADAIPPLSESTLGATLGYDFVAQSGDGQTRASALLDAAISGSWGVFSYSLLAGNGIGATSASNVRLETAFRQDDPATFTRLTVGDSVTQNAIWSTPFRFGGVQYGTQFGLRPGYVRYPTPTVQAGAAVPSMVELYVNDSLRYQGDVRPGAFVVDRLPVLTGAGEMRFRVTDAQGVARDVTAPYYVSSSLLRPGLSDHSVELGWTRLNYGRRSFDYGPPFASGNWRHGLSDRVTVDLHGEGSARTQMAGAGVTWVWPVAGEFALHGAASRRSGEAAPDFGFGFDPPDSERPRHGYLGRASFARFGNDWSVSASVQAASAGFSQVGWEDSNFRVRQQRQFFVGRSLGRAGSLGASLTTIDYDRGDSIKLVSLSYSVPLGSRALLSVYAALSESERQPRNTTTGVVLTIPLGDRQTVSASTTHDSSGSSFSTEINQPPPSDAGWGYRAGITRGTIDRSQAQVLWRTPVTTLGFEAAEEQGRSAARVTATGVLGVAGGRAFALQEPSDALAIVTVPGAAGITVFRENQPVARTDADGLAIVPGLRPYDRNQLLIDVNELPISSHVRQSGMTVVPRLRGVATARFDITDSAKSSASLRIVMPDGNALPPGTPVDRTGRMAETLTAGFSGVVWLAEPEEGERLGVAWKDGTCRVTVDAIPAAGILPDLGERPCIPDR